uniref:PiggyBac transposable element-derived protein domain-containing protein n=1 Tax=Denticeps clupeoides TaxID=299321 RepID=A0AAY4DZV3_9TELE
MIADIMPRKRFKLLRRFIHFNGNYQFNNSPDRFYKIRPLFEMLRKQCLQIPSTHKNSVDEVMVAYKGTRAGTLRQYIANKPDKWGFKLFCRASSSGIIHDLLLYQGASTFFNVPLTEEEQMLPLGAKIVTTLSKTITEPELSVVFCDNYFTSFDLIQILHTNLGVKCIGTVRPNGMGGATLITDKELIKKGRGAFDFRSAEGVLAVKWFDNKCQPSKQRMWDHAYKKCQACIKGWSTIIFFSTSSVASAETLHPKTFHSKMCVMTTWDTCHFTLTTGADVSSVQRECQGGNVRSAKCFCV